MRCDHRSTLAPRTALGCAARMCRVGLREVPAMSMATASGPASRDWVHVLYEVTRQLASTLELEEVLGKVLELTVRAVEADAGSVFLLDGEGRVTKSILARGNVPARVKSTDRRHGDEQGARRLGLPAPRGGADPRHAARRALALLSRRHAGHALGHGRTAGPAGHGDRHHDDDAEPSRAASRRPTSSC